MQSCDQEVSNCDVVIIFAIIFIFTYLRLHLEGGGRQEIAEGGQKVPLLVIVMGRCSVCFAAAGGCKPVLLPL